MVSLLEFTSTLLVFISTLQSEAGTPSSLGLTAAPMMVAAAFVPLALEVYDGFVVPVLAIVRAGRANGDGVKKILITVILTPGIMLMKKLGFGGAITSSAGALAKTAKKTKVAKKKGTAADVQV